MNRKHVPLAVAILGESLRAVLAFVGSSARVRSEMIAQVAAFFEQLVAVVCATLEYHQLSSGDFVSEFDGLVPIFWEVGKTLR